MGYKKIKDFLRNLINPLLPAVAYSPPPYEITVQEGECKLTLPPPNETAVNFWSDIEKSELVIENMLSELKTKYKGIHFSVRWSDKKAKYVIRTLGSFNDDNYIELIKSKKRFIHT